MTIPNNFGLLIVLFSLSYNSSVMVTNPYLLKNTDFVDAIAMLCLPCNKKAVVSGGQVRDTVGFDNAIQFTCTHCGHAIKYTNTSKFSVFTTNRGVAKYAGILFFDSQTVPYFNFPLWSMVKIPWSIIWRYKALHLKVLENYIASKKRSRNGISHQIKASLVRNHLTDDPNDFVAPVVLERMLSVSDLCKVDLSRCGAEVSVKDMPQHLGLFLEETQQQLLYEYSINIDGSIRASVQFKGVFNSPTGRYNPRELIMVRPGLALGEYPSEVVTQNSGDSNLFKSPRSHRLERVLTVT